MTKPSRITEIIGKPMSAVSFVQDYIEFHFDGCVLRAFTQPLVITDSKRFVVPERDSRDALCELIGKTVVNVMARDQGQIDVRFHDGSLVSIPLDVSNRQELPEAAHFVPGENQPIEIW